LELLSKEGLFKQIISKKLDMNQDEKWLIPKPQSKKGVFGFVPIPESEKRSVLIASTYTPKQADAIKQFADSKGITRSELLRLAIYRLLKENDALGDTSVDVDENQLNLW